MTELSFLIDLILNEKLTKRLKERISERIKEIESQPQVPNWMPTHSRNAVPTVGVSIHDGQPESTKRLMEKHRIEEPLQIIQPQTSGVSLAAQQALQARNDAIMQAVSGREEKGRTSPRKF